MENINIAMGVMFVMLALILVVVLMDRKKCSKEGMTGIPCNPVICKALGQCYVKGANDYEVPCNGNSDCSSGMCYPN